MTGVKMIRNIEKQWPSLHALLAATKGKLQEKAFKVPGRVYG